VLHPVLTPSVSKDLPAKRSLLFYASVAEMPGSEYREAIASLRPADVAADLGDQYRTLCTIASGKYRLYGVSAWLLWAGGLLPMACLLGARLLNL
jgi:hypothetical protein